MRERPLTPEEEHFFAGFVDMTTDEQRRKNRDSSVRQALADVSGGLGAIGQGARIKEQTDGDRRIAGVLHQVKQLLEGIATPEPATPRRRRRR